MILGEALIEPQKLTMETFYQPGLCPLLNPAGFGVDNRSWSILSGRKLYSSAIASRMPWCRVYNALSAAGVLHPQRIVPGCTP